MSSTRVHYFLILFICTIIVIAVYWQDIFPLRRELVLSKQQEQQFIQQLQKLYYQEILLEEKMGELPETKSKLNEWQKKFIKQDDMSKLLNEIMAISKRDQLQIKFFDAESIIQENNYVKQPFKIILVGDYSHIAQFVEEVGSLPWTVVVGNFSLSRLSDKTYSTELNFYIYYYKPNTHASNLLNSLFSHPLIIYGKHPLIVEQPFQDG